MKRCHRGFGLEIQNVFFVMPNFQSKFSRPAKKIGRYDPYCRYIVESSSNYIQRVNLADKKFKEAILNVFK